MEKEKSLGRNETCPCGSGKKYKKCCLDKKEVKQTSTKYLLIPKFGVKKMAADDELAGYASIIETCICNVDNKVNQSLTGREIAEALESLLDKYYFKEDTLVFSTNAQILFLEIDRIIKEDLSDLSNEIISKLLSTIYQSLCYWGKEGKKYLNFINRFF